MKHTGKIIVLAFPDTYVNTSNEWICKLLPLFGLGTKEYIKAGHAALVLIENETGNARYFDFGRYATPKGNGRLRGANTDAELHLPFTANLSEKSELRNLDDLLIWIHKNPLKTHGQGRLLASVCSAIDFEKASTFIHQLQNRGSSRYGAFGKEGTNCSRFVTDTLLAATDDKKIIKALNFNKKFTPSTVGNVEKANTLPQLYEVFDGKVALFQGSALKENLTNYFHKKKPKNDTTAAAPKVEKTFSKNLKIQELSGLGCSSWFEVIPTSLPQHHFNIKRYNISGKVDYDGVYVSEQFDPLQAYQFTYDSHCGYCHIIQQDQKIKLESVGTLARFNSLRKQRSA